MKTWVDVDMSKCGNDKGSLQKKENKKCETHFGGKKIDKIL